MISLCKLELIASTLAAVPERKEHSVNPPRNGRAMADHLLPYPLTPKTVHLCVDMQRLFSEDGPWPTPWMARVLPVIEQIVQAHPERTVFSRFITPVDAREMPGMWQRYYARWRIATQSCVNPDLLELMPELRRYSPPATVIDKTSYSAFFRLGLMAAFARQGRRRAHLNGVRN